jgi:hypothetical protein
LNAESEREGLLRLYILTEFADWARAQLQLSADRGEQNICRNRFDQVLGPESRGRASQRDIVVPGHDDARDGALGHRNQLQTVEGAEPDIHEQNVWAGIPKDCVRDLHVFSGEDTVPICRKQSRQRLADETIIVDNKDGCAHSHTDVAIPHGGVDAVCGQQLITCAAIRWPRVRRR